MIPLITIEINMAEKYLKSQNLLHSHSNYAEAFLKNIKFKNPKILNFSDKNGIVLTHYLLSVQCFNI